jgi:hypothetical protein
MGHLSKQMEQEEFAMALKRWQALCANNCIHGGAKKMPKHNMRNSQRPKAPRV